MLVQVSGLRKSYDTVLALQGVSFTIGKGEVFGLLGPNGAGKTTTIEILEGLRQPDSGEVTVCGLDPFLQSRHVKQRIGAQLQNTVLPDKIRVDEALRLYGSFYQRHVTAEKLMERFGLLEKRDAFFENLSGGQKQRVSLALALVNDPELVLLDEPTVGLDVQVRRDIYGLIEQLRSEGRTVLLTTHYIEEAERLCDRVAIIDRGQVVALGSPRDLIQHSSQGTRLEVRVENPLDLEQIRRLEGLLECRQDDSLYVLNVQSVAKAVVALVRYLEADGNTLLDLHVARPSLEDVFVELTGRKLED